MSQVLERPSIDNGLSSRSLEARAISVMTDIADVLEGDTDTYSIHAGEIGRALIYPLADPPCVAKIPLRFDFQSSSLPWESIILEYLGQKQKEDPPPVRIPKLLWHDQDLLYDAFEYIPGTSTTLQELQSLSESEKAAFGKQIGSFVCWLARAFDLPAYYQLMGRQYSPIDKTKDILRNRGLGVIGELDLAGQHVLASACEVLHKDYGNYRRAGAITSNIVGHEDLNPGNLIFTQTAGENRLQGIIDFGITKPSTIERELRFLPSVGKTALCSAIQTCEELTGKPVQPELIQFWNRVQVTPLAVNAILNNGPKAERPLLRQRLEVAWAGWEGNDWREFA